MLKRRSYLFLAGIIFALVLCEIGLRLLIAFTPDKNARGFVRFMQQQVFPFDDPQGRNPLFRKSADRDLGWEPIPNAKWGDIRINSGGFRGKEVTVDPGNSYRIAVLGDSETFARRLKEEETLAGQMEAQLNSRNPSKKFEVLNFGVIGYNTAQEFALLKKRVLPYRPSLIVLYYVLNDAEISTPISFVGNQFFTRSYLIQFGIYTYESVKTVNDLKKDSKSQVEYYQRLYSSIYFQAVKDTVRQMGKFLSSKGIPVILLIAPETLDVPGFGNTYPYQNIHREFSTLSASNVKVVDPLPAMAERFSNPRDVWVTPTDPHKNAEANRVIASVAADAILGFNAKTQSSPR